MKVLAINQVQSYNCQKYKNTNQCNIDRSIGDDTISGLHYYPVNISFGLQNARNLRTLFSYGLPCIYTGIEMIDPRALNALIEQGIHKLPAIKACKYMDAFQQSMVSNEKEIYQIMKEQAARESKKTIHEVFQDLKSQYETELIRKQIPILKTLQAYSYSLPPNMQKNMQQLIEESENKIYHRPISSRFSVTEFNYKLEKIKKDVSELHDTFALGTVNHIIKLSKLLDSNTTDKNVEKQKKIIQDMESYIKRPRVRKSQALVDLIKISMAKLNNEKTIIPFSRKTFIYDLSQVIKTLEDEELKNTYMKIASKLPTSKSSNAAYIMKFAKEPSEKILYRLLWPSIATVEHILPRASGGNDVMANYAGASARANSDRHDIPFVEQLLRKPNTPEYCQKYVDRLIKYAKEGVFEQENIDVIYIENFKDTIAKQSEGRIILDTSALYIDNPYPISKAVIQKRDSIMA